MPHIIMKSIFKLLPKCANVKLALSNRVNHRPAFLTILSSRYYSSATTSDTKLETCNVGTLGHIDHGKTTLTSALTKYCAKIGKSKFVSYEDIDHAPQEKSRGITINLYHVGYRTEKRLYAHTDCPGHRDYIKNMISGTSQMDGAILVVAATDGEMPQTREHLVLAKQIGVKNIIVFINKADIVSKDMLELVEIELRELLDRYNFDGSESPFVIGSAKLALEEDQSEYGEPAIAKLLHEMDNYLKVPERDLNTPFHFPIDNFISVKGRGTVIIGTLKSGQIKKKDKAVVMGFGKSITTLVNDIQVFHKSVPQVVAGDHCGILIKNVKVDDLKRGMALCTLDSTLNNNYDAELYLLTAEESNHSVKAVSNKFCEGVFSETWTTFSRIDLLGDKEMLMPGEHGKIRMVLRQAMPLRIGQRFTIRTRNEQTTIAMGIISKIHPMMEINNPNAFFRNS